jgi:molybdopterin synthase catalytic subunit
MSVRVQIVDGPVGPVEALEAEGAGAVVLFEGIVRPMEEGRELAALDYQAYEPMAQREMEKLAAELSAKHGLMAVTVVHSRGRVAVGERSLTLVIAAAHRGPALLAMGEYIDRLKKDVPIWKKPVWL